MQVPWLCASPISYAGTEIEVTSQHYITGPLSTMGLWAYAKRKGRDASPNNATQNTLFWVACHPWAPCRLASHQCFVVCSCWRASQVGFKAHRSKGTPGLTPGGASWPESHEPPLSRQVSSSAPRGASVPVLISNVPSRSTATNARSFTMGGLMQSYLSGIGAS
jgi:hypothetical protein